MFSDIPKRVKESYQNPNPEIEEPKVPKRVKLPIDLRYHNYVRYALMRMTVWQMLRTVVKWQSGYVRRALLWLWNAYTLIRPYPDIPESTDKKGCPGCSRKIGQ